VRAHAWRRQREAHGGLEAAARGHAAGRRRREGARGRWCGGTRSQGERTGRGEAKRKMLVIRADTM
jgi:hypothetical protein